MAKHKETSCFKIGKGINMGKLMIISPMHIGGREQTLHYNIDFIWDRNTCYVLNEDEIARELLNLPKSVQDQFYQDIEQKDFDLNEFFRQRFGAQYAQKLSLLTSYSTTLYPGCPGGRPPRQIKPFIRNGYAQPFVPGTSVKGAIRNAVLWCYVQYLESNHKAEYNALVQLIDNILKSNRNVEKAGDKLRDEINEKVFQCFQLQDKSGDSHTNIFRSLSVGDTEPLDKDSLKVAVVNVLSLESTHPNGWVYSSGRDKKTGRRRGKPFPIYVECLPPPLQPLSLHLSTDAELIQEFTPSTCARISLKEFLIQESLRRYGSPVDSQKLLQTVLEFCQSFTDAAVQREISFLAQLRGVNAVLDFYKKAFYTNPQSVNLDPPSLPLPDKPERPTLRIGWGSGLEEASILFSLPSSTQDMVKKLFLERVWRGWRRYYRSFLTFPKTRRFIVGDGVPPPPTMPLGWVRIEE
jgi:CRISPR/Cas system CSM-associated protein Csm5 (group 7 of RAMP superfamily)